MYSLYPKLSIPVTWDFSMHLPISSGAIISPVKIPLQFMAANGLKSRKILFVLQS